MFCFVRLLGRGPAESLSRRLESTYVAALAPAAVPAACGCVPHGQWALRHAIVMDLSACLVEPSEVDGALLLLPVLVQAASSTSGAVSGPAC